MKLFFRLDWAAPVGAVPVTPGMVPRTVVAVRDSEAAVLLRVEALRC